MQVSRLGAGATLPSSLIRVGPGVRPPRNLSPLRRLSLNYQGHQGYIGMFF